MSLFASPGNTAASNLNEANRTILIVSGILLSTPQAFCTLCQVKVIQGHEVINVKLKILGLGGVIHVFRSYFRQELKNDPRTLFERPNRTKLENRKII